MNRRVHMCVLLLLVAPFSWVMAADSAEQLLNEAKVVFKKADSLQGAWLTTDKLIKKAESSLQEGDKETALKLAKKAKIEAELSLKQAEEQQKNWIEPAYIKR